MSKKRLKPIEEDDGVERKYSYPLFSFKHLQTSVSYKNTKDTKFFIVFLERLNKLSLLGWEEIRKSQRHSYGMEKIPIGKIKPQLPNFITPDIKELHVFRATGSNKVFVGLQQEDVFHVIFIEAEFGEVYKH